MAMSSWLKDLLMRFVGLQTNVTALKISRKILPKVADMMKTVHLIIDKDFMLQIEGTLSSKIFLLNLFFQLDQFFGTKDCPFLDLGLKQILVRVGNDGAIRSLC